MQRDEYGWRCEWRRGRMAAQIPLWYLCWTRWRIRLLAGRQGPKVSKIASVVKLPVERKSRVAAQARVEGDATRPQPIVTTENLGMQTVQGLPVLDVRTTTIVPVGRSGNDAPITKTQEVWTSPELKLVMKEQWNDPRSGERTIELDNFSQAEPDPALFHPPQGYEVKNTLESLKELAEKMSAAQN